MRGKDFWLLTSVALSLGMTQLIYAQNAQTDGMTNTNSVQTVQTTQTTTTAPASPAPTDTVTGTQTGVTVQNTTTGVTPTSVTTTTPTTSVTTTGTSGPPAPSAIVTTTPVTIQQTTTDTTKTLTIEQANLTPVGVLMQLKTGNLRFASGSMQHRDWIARASETATAQMPEAIVLSCMDSRTPPEIIFDQGIGDIFGIRIAGNILNDDIIGSMEFGTKIAGAKLIAVIGHTNCGAIRGACQQEKLGLLTPLLQKIQPAIRAATKDNTKRDCTSETFIDEVARENVLQVMGQIQNRSPVIQKLIQEGKLGIIGGVYDLSTGRVTFLDDHSIMPVEIAPVAPTTHINNVTPATNGDMTTRPTGTSPNGTPSSIPTPTTTTTQPTPQPLTTTTPQPPAATPAPTTSGTSY